MKYSEVDFVRCLRESFYTSKSEILENLGYIIDNDFSNCQKLLVYYNKNVSSVIVLFFGVSLKDFNIFQIPSLVKEVNDRIKFGEIGIKKINEKYKDYNDIIFIGHSIGGHIINKNLNGTKYKCYTFNPFFVTNKPSNNIKNYRTSGDILSYNLDTEIIEIDLWNYLHNNNFDIIKFLIDSHSTTSLNENGIKIELPIE
uniref:Uncharacterized protein n=1 Tax=viral metagenome TaxID=1070528 RepID=A0A6C0KM51_9ZZZZ